MHGMGARTHESSRAHGKQAARSYAEQAWLADLHSFHVPVAWFLQLVQADYQINPRRRRGGQEALPEMVNTLVSWGALGSWLPLHFQ